MKIFFKSKSSLSADTNRPVVLMPNWRTSIMEDREVRLYRDKWCGVDFSERVSSCLVEHTETSTVCKSSDSRRGWRGKKGKKRRAFTRRFTSFNRSVQFILGGVSFRTRQGDIDRTFRGCRVPIVTLLSISNNGFHIFTKRVVKHDRRAHR